MGEKGLASANERTPATVTKAAAATGTAATGTATTGTAATDTAMTDTAMTESVSGRFEEAARRAQERISQRSGEKTKRATSGDDVTKT